MGYFQSKWERILPPASPVAQISVGGRVILPLLGERAGVRAFRKLTFPRTGAIMIVFRLGRRARLALTLNRELLSPAAMIGNQAELDMVDSLGPALPIFLRPIFLP